MSIIRRVLRAVRLISLGKPLFQSVTHSRLFQNYCLMIMCLQFHIFFTIDFQLGKQEDAEEFLSCILDGMHEEMSAAVSLNSEPNHTGIVTYLTFSLTLCLNWNKANLSEFYKTKLHGLIFLLYNCS